MRLRCPACHRQYRLARHRILVDTTVRPHCLGCRVELRLARVVGLHRQEAAIEPPPATDPPPRWHRQTHPYDRHLQDVATLAPVVRWQRRARRRMWAGLLLGVVAVAGEFTLRAEPPALQVLHATAKSSPSRQHDVALAVPTEPSQPWLDVQVFTLALASVVYPQAPPRAVPVPAPVAVPMVAKARPRRRLRTWLDDGLATGKRWLAAGPSVPLLPSPTATDD